MSVETAAPSQQTQSGPALFFITVGLFGLYIFEFGLVGMLPAIIGRFELTIMEASWLLGSFALIVAIFGPIMVLLVGRYDRRILLTASLIVFALSSIASVFAPTFWTLLAIRVPSALLHAVVFSVAFSTARSMFPEEKAARATSIAFTGLTAGAVLGTPLIAWLEATVSYEASFYFIAIANLLAAVGIWSVVPTSSSASRKKLGGTTRVLAQRSLWLALAQVVSVFAAIVSVFGYAAEYLQTVSGLDGQDVSILLLVLGLGGVLGNLLAGKLLDHWLFRTVLFYPVALSATYLLLLVFGSASFAALLPVCLIWGIGHAAGPIISQIWTVAAAPNAPEFVVSLVASAGSVGVLVGSTMGAVFITAVGMHGVIYSGWAFSALAIVLLLISRLLMRQASEVPRV